MATKKKTEKKPTADVKPKPKGELPPREAARREPIGTESGREPPGPAEGNVTRSPPGSEPP
jgi:hypothetical protein